MLLKQILIFTICINMMTFAWGEEDQVQEAIKTSRRNILLPPAIDQNGNHLQLNYHGAKDYCNSIGTHLPSVLEWAQYAVDNGAAGISKIKLSGYLPIKMGPYTDPLFYFNSKGYSEAPENKGVYWTSEPLWGEVMGASFRTNNFESTADFWTSTNATAMLKVRCVL